MLFGRNLSNALYIVDGARTPIGSQIKGLKHYSAAELAAIVIKELIRRNKINKYLVKQVILGNAVSAGLGQNFARQAALGADLPESALAYSVNSVCGSGLQSMILGTQSILVEDADLVLVGASESASHCPFLVDRESAENFNFKEKKLVDSLLLDGLYCQIAKKSMGELVEELVKKYDITREEQDRFSLESHRKAILAQNQNRFIDEIVPVKISAQKYLTKDERPRANVKIESFKDLPPAFKNGGTVTAGNASSPSDGAVVFLLASKEFIKINKVKPKARILGYVSLNVKPETTFEAISEAMHQCLLKCRLSVKHIDLFEVSEAFAAQVLLAKNKMGIPEDKLNVYGGDIALGHPLGAAGSRALVTLMHALSQRRLKRGLVCVSYGGGGTMAVIIETVI